MPLLHLTLQLSMENQIDMEVVVVVRNLDLRRTHCYMVLEAVVRSVEHMIRSSCRRRKVAQEVYLFEVWFGSRMDVRRDLAVGHLEGAVDCHLRRRVVGDRTVVSMLVDEDSIAEYEHTGVLCGISWSWCSLYSLSFPEYAMMGN